MNSECGAISGVEYRDLTRAADARGSFSEIWRAAWMPRPAPMVQANRSDSKAGVLRGLHYHLAQADYWVVISGEIAVCLLDVRRSSPTRNLVGTYAMSAGTPAGLYIPPGVAHGFYAVTDVVLLYLVDCEYDGGDEFGLAWNDPLTVECWPTSDPILSERDRMNPFLAEIPDDKLPLK